MDLKWLKDICAFMAILQTVLWEVVDVKLYNPA